MRSTHRSLTPLLLSLVVAAACSHTVKPSAHTAKPSSAASVQDDRVGFIRRLGGRVLDSEAGASFPDPGTSFARKEKLERASLVHLVRVAGPQARAYVLRDDASETLISYFSLPAPSIIPGFVAGYQKGKVQSVVDDGGTVLRDEFSESERFARLDHRDREGEITCSLARFLPLGDGSSRMVILSVHGKHTGAYQGLLDSFRIDQTP